MPRSLVLRSVVRLLVAWGGLSLFAGCTHMVESRVVQAFANSLREHDLAQLRENASSEFEDKALPGDEAFDALKFLNLPEGKAKIVKVVDKTDGTDAKTVVSK